VDSETRVQNIQVEGSGVFPDTCSIKFGNDGVELCELLNQKAPINTERKIPVEYLPASFLDQAGFSGAKIETVSNLQFEPSTDTYITFDARVYDYGGYSVAQAAPPIGYIFCVAEEGLFGIGISLKVNNGHGATYLRLTAKISRYDLSEDYSLLLLEETDLDTVNSLYTGIHEVLLEEGDCVSFVVEQDGWGMIYGGGATDASIHKIARVPEPTNTTVVVSGSGTTTGSVLDCLDVQDCFKCPEGITSAYTDVEIVTPSGYVTSNAEHSLELTFDNMGCSASLTGQIILPEPSHPINCDPWDLINCLSQANATTDDLQLKFTNEQLLAISDGFVTNLQHSLLMARVAALELLTGDWTTFTQFQITLIQPTSGGVISLAPDTQGRKYNEGAVVVVTLTVDDGHAFDTFKINGIDYIEDPDPSHQGELIPFADAQHVVTVIQPTSGATLSLNPDEDTYDHGEQLVISCDTETDFGLEEVLINGEAYKPHSDGSAELVLAADTLIPTLSSEGTAYLHGPSYVVIGDSATYELKGIPYNKELDFWKYNGVVVTPTTNGTQLLSNDRIIIDPVPDIGFNLEARLKLKY
jgi:hypothetical protein